MFAGIAVVVVVVDDDGVDMAMVLKDEDDAFVLPVLRLLIIINF